MYSIYRALFLSPMSMKSAHAKVINVIRFTVYFCFPPGRDALEIEVLVLHNTSNIS